MDVKGLDNMIDRLDLQERSMKKIIIEATDNLGNKLKDNTIRRTPVDTGVLQQGWKLKRNNNYEVAVYNEEKYATPVEFGRRNGGKGVTQGAYMLTKSVESMEDLIGEEFKAMIEAFW